MAELLTNQSKVELLYLMGKYGELPFYSYKDILFSELKKGDIFRIKVAEDKIFVQDFYGNETFTCLEDACFDKLKGWSVSIDE